MARTLPCLRLPRSACAFPLLQMGDDRPHMSLESLTLQAISQVGVGAPSSTPLATRWRPARAVAFGWHWPDSSLCLRGCPAAPHAAGRAQRGGQPRRQGGAARQGGFGRCHCPAGWLAGRQPCPAHWLLPPVSTSAATVLNLLRLHLLPPAPQTLFPLLIEDLAAANCVQRADSLLVAAYLAGARIKHPNAEVAAGAKRRREDAAGGGHGPGRGHGRGRGGRRRFPGQVCTRAGSGVAVCCTTSQLGHSRRCLDLSFVCLQARFAIRGTNAEDDEAGMSCSSSSEDEGHGTGARHPHTPAATPGAGAAGGDSPALPWGCLPQPRQPEAPSQPPLQRQEQRGEEGERAGPAQPRLPMRGPGRRLLAPGGQAQSASGAAAVLQQPGDSYAAVDLPAVDLPAGPLTQAAQQEQQPGHVPRIRSTPLQRQLQELGQGQGPQWEGRTSRIRSITAGYIPAGAPDSPAAAPAPPGRSQAPAPGQQQRQQQPARPSRLPRPRPTPGPPPPKPPAGRGRGGAARRLPSREVLAAAAAARLASQQRQQQGQQAAAAASARAVAAAAAAGGGGGWGAVVPHATVAEPASSDSRVGLPPAPQEGEEEGEVEEEEVVDLT